ncbi:MAG TPA: discoidin domain-containing protein [Pedobacter sp.]|uniref:discoidin domain-containing protein n=1 Tax=Pedobacter sp. TaxID=1411316 RepID=UPI002CE7D325|nr:discoidin domain-containing protein [Pedobacter sp.]HMI02705.1 discoidin domain-containing protein [Pedobacter sp.]
MKRSNFYSKYLVALLLGALIFQVGCKRESGYYKQENINTGTDLNMYDYLKSKAGVYDSLLFLIDAFKMKSYLTDSSVTLFAPSNSSFQTALLNLNNIRRAQNKNAVFLKDIVVGTTSVKRDLAKKKADSMNLDTMVSRYIIRGLFKSADFSVGDGRALIAARSAFPMHGRRLYADAQGWQNGGSEVIEFANTKRSVFVPNWATTSTSSVNIQAKNGVVHLLEPDHVFGFDEFSRRLTLIPPPKNLILDDMAAYKKALVENPGLPKPFSVKFNGTYEDGQVSGGERIDKLFDNNILTKFIARFLEGNNNPIKITYSFYSGPQVANVYTVSSANDVKNRDPKAWVLEGSLDGTNWVQLDTRQDQDFNSRFETKIYDFPNTVAYKYYRLTVVSNLGDNLFQISEWSLNYREVFD